MKIVTCPGKPGLALAIGFIAFAVVRYTRSHSRSSRQRAKGPGPSRVDVLRKHLGHLGRVSLDSCLYRLEAGWPGLDCSGPQAGGDAALVPCFPIKPCADVR